MARSRSRLSETISKFNQKAEDTQNQLDKNPFSDTYERPVHNLTDQRYGRPEAGSKTEKRGIKAGNYVMREIIFLCEIISRYGQHSCDPNGAQLTTIKFGPLFDLYATYSDKVVGMLIRARKHGLVHFEGEMLYQRQDDHKVITLLKPLEEIKQCMQQSGDPKHCLAFKP